MIHQSTLAPVGVDQCRQFLKGLRPKDESREIWVKFGHDSIYRATWDEKGNLSGIATSLVTKSDPSSRTNKGKPIPDLIKHLHSLSQKEDGGVFFVPTQPIGLPLAECVTSTDDIGIEMDHLPMDEQKSVIAAFCKVTGLEFASVLTSGGTSIHLHLKMDGHYPVEVMEYFRRMAVIAFQSDPVTVRLHQPMRLPGFFRKEKDAYQELLSLSDLRYTPDELTCAFDRWFEYKNLPFTYTISGAWWSDVWHPLLASSNPSTPALKQSDTQRYLTEGNAAYLNRRAAESEQQRERIASLPAITGEKISDLVQACCDRANVGDFNGVDWQGSGGHYRGQCPFHEGKSGNSAWLSDAKGALRFHCSSCTGDAPRTSFEYWVAQHGLSSIDEHHGLKGKDYVEAAKVFLSEHGVGLPKMERTKDAAPTLNGNNHKPKDAREFDLIDGASLQGENCSFPENKNNHFTSSLGEGLIYNKVKYKKGGGFDGFDQVNIGDHITALAYVDSPTKNEAQLYIEFKARKELRTLTIKRADLAGDGTEVIKFLHENSYFYNRKQKALLLDYLNKLGKDCELSYIVTNRTGWIQDSFVLPDRSFGNTMIRFQQVDKPVTPIFDEIGTLDQWQKNVAAKTIGNSRLTFSIGISFSAPLASLLSIESGGYHFYGPTSTGKTSSLWVAASVYGQEKQTVLPWRLTANALEYKAAARNNLALFLDEIGQATAQDVASGAYMLANGQGKARLTKHLTERDSCKWNLTFLSSGEHTLISYLEKGGLGIKGGQENRMPSIPATVKNGYGVFETCHGLEPAQFSSEIKKATQAYCGTAFSAFMDRLIIEKNKDGFESRIAKRHFAIRASLTRTEDYNEVLERVADRMACVQLGLELAIEYEVIQHTMKEVEWSVQTIFKDWVKDRGGAVNFELKNTLEAIEHLFVTQEYSDRIFDLGANSTTFSQKARNLFAYKRGHEFFVPPSVFEKDFVGELNRDTLIKELIRKGWLVQGKENKPYQARKIVDKTQRVYVFLKFWATVPEDDQE
jgi:uncharacterized protein (DUF927 family)